LRKLVNAEPKGAHAAISSRVQKFALATDEKPLVVPENSVRLQDQQDMVRAV